MIAPTCVGRLMSISVAVALVLTLYNARPLAEHADASTVVPAMLHGFFQLCCTRRSFCAWDALT